MKGTCTVVYLSCAVSGSRQDVVVTEPSSALSSSLKSDPTPDSTSSMSSCETASPSAKMLLSVSLLRATRCRSSSHAFDIFFDDNGDVGWTDSGGGGAGGGGGGFISLLTAASTSAMSTTRPSSRLCTDTQAHRRTSDHCRQRATDARLRHVSQ